MSDDEKAAKELVETLKDGERGFADAAEKLRHSDHPEWAATLQRLSEQRASFCREIVDLGHQYGDDVDESGSGHRHHLLGVRGRDGRLQVSARAVA